MPSVTIMESMNALKTHHCTVAPKGNLPEANQQDTLILPDGVEVSTIASAVEPPDWVKAGVPELLFMPEHDQRLNILAGSSTSPVHKLLSKSIERACADAQLFELKMNVMPSGGTSNLAGFHSRLVEEIKADHGN